MSHAVHYRGAAGDIHLEDRPSLDTALELVERLQNEDGASEVRVFREVPIEMKTYYRAVAVAVDAAGDTDAAPLEPVAHVAAPPIASVVEPQVTSAAEPRVAPNVAPQVTSAAALADAAPAPDADSAPGAAPAPRLAPVEPPSGATIMSPPPASVAPAGPADDDHDEDSRGEHRRALFSRG